MSQQQVVRQRRLSPRLLTGIFIALFFGISLFLRIYLPYDQVFSGEWIKFTSSDAYYHMNLVDNLVQNFPHFMSFNPYFIYPSGGGVGSIHFFEWLLASITWVIGLGSPTQHTIDVVGVYLPAILAALTVIPVYFIGKELFGRWAGVLAAGLIALMPGEFMGRSILGFTDNPAAETLFTTVTILFLILAIKAARQRELTFNHLYRRDWSVIAKPIIYSLLAGIFLGIYFITWLGALLFVFIISLYLIVQFTIDHLKHRPTDYLCLIGVILFLITLLIFLPVSPGKFYLAPLVIALFIPLVLSGVSWLMVRQRIKPAYYLLALVGLGLAGLGIFYAIAPSLVSSMLEQFRIFFAPTSVSRTTMEMQPLLFPLGDFTLILAWGNFTTGFFLSFLALIILIWAVVKQGDAEKGLLVIWSLVILAATLGQRRFAYYLAVNVALLTGYFSILVYLTIRLIVEHLAGRSPKRIWQQILNYAGLQRLAVQPTEMPKKAEREKGKARPEKRPADGFNITARQITIFVGTITVFFLAFFPNISPAATTASQAAYAPSDAWQSSLLWMKDNTPDPFGNPDFYYELHESPPPGESYEYPESAYGVMAWWDYGYWITRIAHRLPNANPSQATVANTNVARFFTSQDEDSANEIIQELDSAYLILDYQSATGKFWAITQWAGKETTVFSDVYYLLQGEEVIAVQLFYPEYYHSLLIQLYNFDGKAVTADSPFVISFEEEVTRTGEAYKLITSVEQFDTYEEAQAYLLSQESANYRIVGIDRFISPVPLEALEHYKLIYSSTEKSGLPGEEATVPSVKIFEYVE